MKHETKQINGHDIFTITNDRDSKTSIILLHGYAEHITRYQRFMDQLDAEGYRIMGYDQKGHGQSGGVRAQIESFDIFVEDLRSQVESFFKAGDNNFIFAHSMGALVAVLYLEKYGVENLTGVVLSGTALQMYKKTPAWLEKMAGVISGIFPSLPTLGLDSSTVSRDPEEVKKYREDPLNFSKPTKAKFGHEFLEAQKRAIRSLSKIEVPIFINHGTDDQLIHMDGSQLLFDSISSKDKTLRLWDGLYHEILNEPEKDQVASEMISWINKRVK